MNLDLKDYQEIKVEELISAFTDLLTQDTDNKVCIFQSPTGSGKTVITAKFIQGLIKEMPDKDLCFLWISIGKGNLHVQSKKSLESIFDGDPKVDLIEDEFFGSRSIIEKNEVVVGNWEKLRAKKRDTGEWKNKVMRDGENVSFIEVLEKTKQKRQIILIIDESHFASDTERTNELRGIVNADVTLEMSATPKIQPTPMDLASKKAYFVYVEPKVVIAEGMIKKELIINEDLRELIDDEKTSQDIIIEAAYNKRLELKRAFIDSGSEINPLCLIQLPNAEAGQAKREVIEAFLADKGITESNGRLSVWLSEDKSEHLDEIAAFDSPVEFLLFKQAIDTGWDCPRAHILVKLRDIKSFTFEVQTVGRILRMPEQMHYQDERLNKGYIFTNLKDIVVGKEEYNPNIIKHLRAIRKPIYKPIKLESYYKSRVDFGDITYSFGKVLEKIFCDEFYIDPNSTMVNIAENTKKLTDKFMAVVPEPYNEKIIVDEIINTTKFDELEDRDFESQVKRTKLRLGDNDLLDVFNLVIRQNLNGFAPKRSISTVRGAIYQWFKKYLGINYSIDNGIIAIQNLFLHPHNISVFSKLLGKATGEYKPVKKAEVKEKIEETIYDWDVKVEEFYNQYTDEKLDYNLCIYDPCYLAVDRSTPEKEFEKFIDVKNDKIEWWFKNGSNKKDFFGIKYEENDLPQTFYPDYIIQLSNSKVFIGDTKAGKTATEAASRAEALQAYIIEQNKKGKNLIGGIILKDSTDKWRLNQEKKYNYDKNDLTKWVYFDDLIN